MPLGPRWFMALGYTGKTGRCDPSPLLGTGDALRRVLCPVPEKYVALEKSSAKDH